VYFVSEMLVKRKSLNRWYSNFALDLFPLWNVCNSGVESYVIVGGMGGDGRYPWLPR